MHNLDVAAVLHAGMLVCLKLCTPLLLAPLAAGLCIALFQAVTQISDSTLSFLPKLCATLATAYYVGPFLARTLSDYMHFSMDQLVLIGAG